MRQHRIVSITLICFLLIITSVIIPSRLSHAQSLFDGVVAYIGTDGNIYILWENGSTQQITFDAAIADDQDYMLSDVSYDFLYLFKDKKYLFYQKKIENDMVEHILYDLSINTLIFSILTDSSELRWPFYGRDESGFYYIVNEYETDDLPSGAFIERTYKQYISGEKELLWEIIFNNGIFRRPSYSGDHNLVIYQENPYELVFYNTVTQEHSRINIPIEKYHVAVWLDNDVLLLDLEFDIIIEINIQSKEVKQWEITIHDVGFMGKTKDGFLITGNHGIETPTSLYRVDTNGNLLETLYTSSTLEPMFAIPSSTSDAICIYEESEEYWFIYSLILLPDQGSPVKISSSASPTADCYLSHDSQKIYYIEANQPSSDSSIVNNTLMSYDTTTGTYTKIVDLLPEGLGPGLTYSLQLNENNVSDSGMNIASSNTVEDSDDQIDPQIQPSPLIIPATFDYTPILIAGGIGMVVLLGIGVGVLVWASRPKSRKTSLTAQVGPPSPLAPQLQTAVRMAKEKQFKESFGILSELAKTESTNPDIWYYLGYNLVNMGDFTNAEICFLRAKKHGHPKAELALKWISKNRQK